MLVLRYPTWHGILGESLGKRLAKSYHVLPTHGGMKDEGRSGISKAQRGAHCMEAAPCHSGASKDRSVLVIILQENQTGLGNVGKLFYGIS